jgi:hypothetical protein
MRTILHLIVFTVLISACNNASEKTEAEDVQVNDIMLAPPAPAKSGLNYADKEENAYKQKSPADTSKKIIKSGDVRFETKDVKQTRQTLVNATQKLNGYVSEETESGYENDQKTYTLVLNVPSNNFDKLLESIASAADHIDSKNIQITDVTAEYIDTRTRLQNKKVLEKRYLQLLDKASKITDMLSIENKLSEIRTEIESVEGQFLHMQKQVSFSTLSITYYTKSVTTETRKGFFYKLTDALNQGFETMQAFFFGLLTLWPMFIVLGMLYLFLIRFRKQKRKAAAQ